MRAAWICSAALTLTFVQPSRTLAAAPPSVAKPADREAARTLATRGYELFQAGSYAEAIAAFRQAEARVHAPPHLLYIARCQVKLRQLIEAKDTLQIIVAEKLPPDASYPFRDAQTSARAELREVDILIPSMSLTLEGVGVEKASVSIDDRPFPTASLGKPVQENPGLHTLVITVPGQAPIERTVLLKQGTDTEHVTITLGPKPSRVSTPAIVTFALGGASVAAGATLLSLYFTQPTLKTTPFQVASIASLAGGGALLGTGTLLVLLRSPAPTHAAPNAARAPSPHVNVGVGLGSITLDARF